MPRVLDVVVQHELVRVRHGSRLIGTHSAFSVLSRRAVAAYLECPDREVMYLAVLERLGLSIASVGYDRQPRAAGTSAYSVERLTRRAWRVLRARPRPARTSRPSEPK